MCLIWVGNCLGIFFFCLGIFFWISGSHHFPCYLQHFGAGNCHFHGMCNGFWVRTSHFPLYFPRYLQQFAACSVHFPCSLQHFWAGICISTVCATFYSILQLHSSLYLQDSELKADIPTVVCCYCYCCWCWCWCCCCCWWWWCCCCCWRWWWWSCCCCC